MGKPLSRPDCLRQNPRCLGKGEDEEAYIEDCYVPQRSIYDTMRINEQIDQGNKISQPSRSTLGSGGEASTLSSNGTLGESVGGVFVARPTDAGAKKLDERVIFDALKLTGDPQSMSPVGGVSSGMHAGPSTSAASGAAAVVTKRRHQGADKKDNPNRRSWKVFMPPSYPEFAERLEISAGEGAEKRLSGAGIPLSPLHPLPSIITPPPTQPYTLQTHTPPPTTSTPTLSSYAPSPVSLGGPHTPPVSSSPSSSPAISPLPLHPLRQRPPQLYSPQQKLPKPQSPLASPARDQRPLLASGYPKPQQGSSDSPHSSPCASIEAGRRTVAAPVLVRKSASEEQPENWGVASAKASDSERDSPLLEDQDTVPLIAPLISPKPVFCPPTKARTWPRSMRGGKRSHLGRLHNLPLLPPLPPLLGEDSDLDEESLYLLDPPSPFLQEGEGVCYGGLPLSPCVSQEGGEEGLLGWAPSGALRERTASELRFEEDERRILQEMEEEEETEEEMERVTEEEIDEGDNKGQNEELEEEERRRMEERDWEAVLKMESKVVVEPCWEGGLDEPQLQDWETQQLNSSGHWPLLTPPTEFGGLEPPSASPCPSSDAGSDDLFLELERQCLEEDDIDVSTETDSGAGLSSALSDRIHTLPRVEEAAEGEEQSVCETVNSETVNSEPFEQDDLMQHTDPGHTDISEAHSNTDQSLPLQEGCSELSLTETTTENGQPQQLADCPQVHKVAEIRDEDENVEHAEDQEHSCSPSVDTNSLVGLVPESDSSGIHESHPDRTALSDTAHTDLELADAETDPEPDSGASSDPEQEGEAEDQKDGRDSSSHAPHSCCLPGPEKPNCEGTGSENTCTEGTSPEGTYTEVTSSNILYGEDTGRADSFQSERPWTEAPEAPKDCIPEDEEDVLQAVASESSPEPVDLEEEVEEKLGDVEFSSQEELVSSEPTDGSMGMPSESEGVSEPDGTPESEEASSEMAALAQDESTSAEGVCADADTSGHELDITDPEPGTMSTPKSNAAQSRAESHSMHTDSAPPSPSPTYPSKPHELSSSHESKEVDAFVTTDSFVYLAVSVPPQYSQDAPPSPLQDCIPPSPLPKPHPDSEECAFMSSDSFVYLAAPERLAVVTDGGSACEDVCNLDSESEGSQSGVDFVLGSMTGDSDWESEGSGLDPVSSASRDQWESLEFGCLQGLFSETHLDTVSFTASDDQDANSTPEPQVSRGVT